jgi:hypothetical protein
MDYTIRKIDTLKKNSVLIKALLFIIVLSFSSCLDQAFINKETSAIGSIYGECLKKDAWDTLFTRYDVNNVKDSLLKEVLTEFENQPFRPYVLYLQDPEEFIGISTDKYMVRYVYNSNLSSKVLDGFMLNDSEKNRILNRVQKLLMEFQCEDGKIQSLDEIKRRKE